MTETSRRATDVDWRRALAEDAPAARSDARVREQAAFADRVLGLDPRDRVLDLGCGTGRQTLELARRLEPGGALSSNGAWFDLRAGLALRKAWGDYHGGAYGLDSRRLIVLAAPGPEPRPARGGDELLKALRIKGRPR